ncbi:LacI family transcriptional regulator [Cryobacterium sp. TmT2-59]|uniref:LacI family transcriptional regulator n=1 Tax=Cryobacterium shii TaxID=1259235 RepID=A0AAQ2C4V8_9MICO|nr:MULTISPECIES: LacI family DNA-binding transcriptional regulator [Cryobacterium]TFC43171.1 LacI family transcriptional regulator [Cryobacterium shii]TFC86234.1 LacI family transcriptional regulator [Cryobacterium sp. TmT2-59]TFD17403.1 LacI family transcriptional regulator [Cryobacterium sp. TMT4-10]TFD20816.1 LacI family transcriptional regulator [Cryobacterium sp. TMT2-23]
MRSIADVARLAGVAKATASRALSGRGYVSEETRSKVVAAAKEIGYVASPNAASLVTGRTKSIGVIIPFISRWFFSEVLESLEQALLEEGYDMTLYNLPAASKERDSVFEYFLARKRFDGVISVGVALSDAEVDLLHRLGRPLVGIGGPIRGVHTIAIDDVASARLATEHLLSLGHKDILHIGGSEADEMDFKVHSNRRTGFASAMNEAGLSTEGSFYACEFTLPGGYGVGLAVLGDPRTRPTAVFAASDEIAIGVIVAARELGIQVPADLSVIGIDGHPYAQMFRLTTLEQHPRRQARLAVVSLLAELESPTDTDEANHLTVLPVNLVVRSSTSGPRQPLGA